MTRLELWFRCYNRRYFRGCLPACRVRWDRKLFRRGYLGECDPERREILVAVKLREMSRLARMTLLHEMVHVKLGLKTMGHGPEFQREMRRLARAGAFKDLW